MSEEERGDSCTDSEPQAKRLKLSAKDTDVSSINKEQCVPLEEGSNKELKDGALEEGSNKELKDGALEEGSNKELKDGALEEGGNKELKDGALEEGGNKELKDGALEEGGNKELKDGALEEGSNKELNGGVCGSHDLACEDKVEIQTPTSSAAVYLREEDVGITEYISSHPGFFAILKQRCSSDRLFPHPAQHYYSLVPRLLSS